MTATLQGVIHEGRLGSTQSGERRYVRVFKVTSDDIDEGPAAITDAVGVSYLDAYSYAAVDSGALAENFTAELAGANPYIWHVTIEYTTRGLNPNEWNADPLSRSWRLRISSEKFKKPAPRDYYGVSKRNSAGELLEGTEKDDGRQVLEYELNVESSFLDVVFSAKDSVNLSEWQGKPAGTLKVDDIRAEPMFEAATEYYHVWLRIHYQPEGWDTVILDRGFHYLDGTPLKLKRFADKSNIPTPEPQFLNGAGGKLADSTTTLAAGVDAAVITIPVADTSTFGAALPYYIEIGDEVMQVITLNANTFTVNRGAKGSTAAAHSNGATVLLAPVELRFQDYPLYEYNNFNIS